MAGMLDRDRPRVFVHVEEDPALACSRLSSAAPCVQATPEQACPRGQRGRRAALL